MAAGVCSSAQEHLDVLKKSPDIIGLRKEAIMVAPMTCRERLAGGQDDLDVGILESNRESEFQPV